MKLLKSIKARLLTSVITISLLVFVATVCSIYFSSTTSDHLDMEKAMRNTLSNTKERVVHRIIGTERAVNRMAPQLYSALDDPEELMRVMRNTVQDVRALSRVGVYIVPENGRKPEMFYVTKTDDDSIYVRHKVGADALRYTEEEWYVMAVRNNIMLWSEPYSDKKISNVPVAKCVKPLTNNLGVVVALCSGDIALRTLSRDMRDMKPYPHNASIALSARGNFLSHPDTAVVLRDNYMTRASELNSPDMQYLCEAMISGDRGTREVSVHGEKWLAVYEPIEHTRWSIASLTPYSDTAKPITMSIIWMFVIILAGGILMYLTLRWLIIGTVDDMDLMRHQVNIMSQGHFNTQIPSLRPNSAVADLRQSLVTLQYTIAQQLAKTRKEEGERVREKGMRETAESMRQSILPDVFTLPQKYAARVQINARMAAIADIGGDLYDFTTHGNHLYFMLGTTQGTGLQATMTASILRSMFRVMAAKHTNPAEMMNGINAGMADRQGENNMARLQIGVMDMDTGRVEICTAGNTQPLMVDNTGGSMLIKVHDNAAVGRYDHYVFQKDSCTLSAGETLVFYTRGLTASQNVAGDTYTVAMMQREAADARSLSAEQMAQKMCTGVRSFKGTAPLQHEITIMTIHMPSAGEWL